MNRKNNTLKLVESAMLVAIGVVLGIFHIFDLPYGGSVTLASMLPVVMISYRHGLSWGLGSGLVYATVQQLLGLKNLSYVTGWQSVVAMIMLDYIVAFCVCGLGGIFRGRIQKQSLSLACGSLLVSVIRYVCHVISGATVWAGISIPTSAALIYSLAYNATYMIPETLVLVIVAYYIGSSVDLTKENITRIPSVSGNGVADVLSIVSSLAGICAAVVDVALVFGHLQDPETGNFDITLLTSGGFFGTFRFTVVIVTVAAAAIMGGCYAARKRILSRAGKQ